MRPTLPIRRIRPAIEDSVASAGQWARSCTRLECSGVLAHLIAALAHLPREIDQRRDHPDRSQQLCDGSDGVPVHDLQREGAYGAVAAATAPVSNMPS